MRRLLMGLMVLATAGCDQGSDIGELELELDDAVAIDDSIDDSIDGLVAEEHTVEAGGGADLKVGSWVHQGEVVSKVFCDYTGNGSTGNPCSCPVGSGGALEGSVNIGPNGNTCVMCRWYQWEDDTCELGAGPASVSVDFQTWGGQTMYAYGDDDSVAQSIDATWTFATDCTGTPEVDFSCPCAYEDENCTCDATSVNFSVQFIKNDQIYAKGDRTLRLGPTGSCASAN